MGNEFPEDRLETVAQIQALLQSCNGTVSEWRKWLRNTAFMTRVASDELEDWRQFWLDTVKSMIRYDIKITSKFEEETLEKQMEKVKKKTESVYA